MADTQGTIPDQNAEQPGEEARAQPEESPALCGTAVGTPTQTLESDMIVERQTMLPSHFECFACGCKVAGCSKLNACGLGDTFTGTSRYDGAEYFGGRGEDEERFAGLEEDFNEW